MRALLSGGFNKPLEGGFKSLLGMQGGGGRILEPSQGLSWGTISNNINPMKLEPLTERD
jgi:hypothetical protein